MCVIEEILRGLVMKKNNVNTECEYKVRLKSEEIKRLKSLTIVICVENSAFRGDQFKVLIDELNEISLSDQCKLKTINIVDTSYLNRHYDKSKFSNPDISEWRRENQEHIDRLIIDHHYISWNYYLEHEKYQQYRNEIEEDYNQNKDNFKFMGDNFAKFFAHKNGMEAAKQYFLEEAAAFRLKEGVILYPGKLKDPFEWVMKHYPDTKVSILPYVIKMQKNTQQSKKPAKNQGRSNSSNGNVLPSNGYQPSLFGLNIASYADQLVGQDPIRQMHFLRSYIDLCSQYVPLQPSTNDSNESEQENNNNVLSFKH